MDGMIVAGTASGCRKIRRATLGATKTSDVSPDSLACIGRVGSSDRTGCVAAIPAADGADWQGSYKVPGPQVLLSEMEGPVMEVASGWGTRTELVPRSEGVNRRVELE